MTIHIKKLCVGVESIEQLRNWQERRGRVNDQGFFTVKHVTRAMPRRKDEVLDGGSLYWVIKGRILARNKILDLRPVENKEGIKKCAIILKSGPIEVIPTKHRPFQGWRYLKAEEAPKDLKGIQENKKNSIPQDMAAELNELGLL